MAKEEVVSFEIDKEIINRIVEKKMGAQLVEALGQGNAIIERIVSHALSVKVNSKGELTTGSSYDSYDFIERMATKSIQEAAREVFQDWLKENIEKLRSAVKTELDKPSTKRKIAKTFVSAAEKSFECNWNMDCTITFKEEDD